MNEYLKINSRKLEVRRYHYDDDLTLVFLHEGLGSVAQWKNFPEKLAKATRCSALVYSRSGYGQSDPCSLPRKVNFMHIEAIKVLPELIRVAGIKHYILIGHSDGGSIAVIYAGYHENPGLKGIITQAAHVFCEKLSVESIKKAKQEYEERELKKKLYKYHGKNTECAFRGWNDVWLNPTFMHFNIEKYLLRIAVPFLAIQGENDQYGTMDQITSIKKNSPTAYCEVLKNCRHAPFIEQEEITLNHMISFIEQIKNGKTAPQV